MHVWYPQSPEEGIRCSGVGTIGICELLNECAGDKQVPWKTGKFSKPLSHVSSPVQDLWQPLILSTVYDSQ